MRTNELINVFSVGLDAIVLFIIAGGIRMHLTRLAALEEKASASISKREVEELIFNKVEERLALLYVEIGNIKGSLDKLLAASLKS